MKKLLLIATFAFVGVASFASNKKPITVKKAAAKKVVVKPSKGTSYPVSVNLTCGTFTFQSNCQGTVAQCIPGWAGVAAAAELFFCGN